MFLSPTINVAPNGRVSLVAVVVVFVVVVDVLVVGGCVGVGVVEGAADLWTWQSRLE